jgi:hypothetical protein
VLGIGDDFRGQPLRKPAGVWCQMCHVGVGCTVYEERPQVCRDFQCLYLQGMLRGEDLPPELRPDRCGVVISPTTDGHLAASYDPHKPDVWKRGAIFKFIAKAVKAGIHVTLSCDTKLRKKILMRGQRRTSAPRVRDLYGRIEVYEMTFTKPDEKGMQWSVPGSEKLIEVIDE